jgi:hypothetical protein
MEPEGSYVFINSLENYRMSTSRHQNKKNRDINTDYKLFDYTPKLT